MSSFQKKLAKLGVTPQAAVSIALPNTYEFIVAFLAASWQRGIAAPLNSAYKQEEFEFYIDDLSSAVALVPKGSFQQDGPAVRAARKYKAAIAECYWNGREVVLDVKDEGKLRARGTERSKRQTQMILHWFCIRVDNRKTKGGPLTHRNLTQTMKNIKDDVQFEPADRTMLVMPLFHVHGLLAAFLAPYTRGDPYRAPEVLGIRILGRLYYA